MSFKMKGWSGYQKAATTGKKAGATGKKVMEAASDAAITGATMGGAGKALSKLASNPSKKLGKKAARSLGKGAGLGALKTMSEAMSTGLGRHIRKKSPYKKVDFPPDDSEFWDYPLYIRGKEVSKEEYKRHMTNNPGDWDLDKKANVEGGAEKSDNLEAWYDEGEDPRGYFEGSGDKESFQEKEIEKSKTVTKPVKKEKEEKEEVDTVHYGAKDYEPKDPKDKGRWKRRRAYKKDLREHGMKRGKARQVALQSIPKRWGKHKGSF